MSKVKTLVVTMIVVLIACTGSAIADIMDNLVWVAHYNDGSFLPDYDVYDTTTVNSSTGAALTTGSQGYPFITANPKEALSLNGVAGNGLVYNYAAPRYEGTFSCWIKPDVGYGMIFSTQISAVDTSHYLRFKYRNNGAGLRVYAQAGAGTDWYQDFTLSGEQVLSIGEWSNIALTWQANGTNYLDAELNVYVDGTLVGTVSHVAIPYYRTLMYVGTASVSDGGTPVDGLLDEAALWNIALSSTEVTQVYDYMVAGNQIPEPATLILLGIGSSSALFIRRRQLK